MDSFRPYIPYQPTPMAEEIRAVSAAAHRIKNCSTKKDAYVGVFFDFGCSGRGRGLPIVPHSRRRRRKRTYIQGAKACFGVGESACGRGVDAACVCGRVLYGAVCIRTLCVQGRRWVFRPLGFTRRSVVAVSPAAPRSSALRHGPPMPRRGAGVVFEFSSQGVSIPCFGLCVRTHTEGACSLFVHLHLNRECNPCPCRSSRYLGASFPFSPPPSLMRSPSPARAGEAEMTGYSLPPSLRGKWRPCFLYFPSSASMISVREVPS